MQDDEGWTVARGPKSFRREPNTHKKHGTQEIRRSEPVAVSPKSLAKSMAAVSAALDTLRGHCYAINLLRAVNEAIGSIENYWVWGLGSMENVGQAQVVRYQLASAVLLKELLDERKGLRGPPEAVDPAFTALDIAVLHSIGFATQTGNHDWTVTEPTLLFAPHLEQLFATELLRTTKQKGSLSDLVYVGNSIAKCLERNQVRRCHSEEDVAFLEKLSTAMRETPLRELGFESMCPGAFNDLSLHTFW
jgi:hypothetical protein